MLASKMRVPRQKTQKSVLIRFRGLCQNDTIADGKDLVRNNFPDLTAPHPALSQRERVPMRKLIRTKS
jgi:hypothetical protein